MRNDHPEALRDRQRPGNQDMTEETLFLNILKAAVTGRPASCTEPVDMQRLWDFARRHSIRASIAPAVLQSPDLPADDVWRRRWLEAMGNNIRKTHLYDKERARILGMLKEAGIWAIPLKGVIINPLYPTYGTREFSDNDILVDGSALDRIEELMESIGYRLESDSVAIHYAFKKEPLYSFELHHRLFTEKKRNERFNRCFDSAVSASAAPDSAERHLSSETQYAYILAHAYKHYQISGLGLRYILDVYLILKKLPLDRTILNDILKELQIEEFTAVLESLSMKIFEPETPFDCSVLSEDERSMLDYSLRFGTSGNHQGIYSYQWQSFVCENGSNSRLKYIKERLFPDMELYKKSYPVFYRHKLLRPVFYIYRPFRELIRNGKGIKSELKAITNTPKE